MVWEILPAPYGRRPGNRIETLGAVTFPHSLGLAYTALTQYLGFPKYGDEYKVMGWRRMASRNFSIGCGTW